MAAKVVLVNVEGYENKAGIGGFGYSNLNFEFTAINSYFENNIA